MPNYAFERTVRDMVPGARCSKLQILPYEPRVIRLRAAAQRERQPALFDAAVKETAVKRLLVAIAGLGWSIAAMAQNTATVEQLLTVLTSQSEAQCSTRRGALVKDYRAQGRISEARSVELAEAMVCDCVPAQAHAVRESLNPTVLRRQVSEAEFKADYLPLVVDKCAGQQFRAMYGEACGEIFSSLVKNSSAYCACMNAAVSQFSDKDAAKSGLDSADYTPRAAAAKKSGAPMPDKPASIARLEAIHKSCMVK